VLDMIARAYLGPGVEAVHTEYSFVVYRIATHAVGATNVVVPAHSSLFSALGFLRTMIEMTREL
jgi:histidinol-phosphate aminotransferase